MHNYFIINDYLQQLVPNEYFNDYGPIEQINVLLNGHYVREACT